MSDNTMSDKVINDEYPSPPGVPAFEVRSLAPGFVAELSGVRLDQPLPPQTIASLKSTWTEFPVLVVPDQNLDPAALAGFAEQLGDFGEDPYIRAVDGHDHVVEIRRSANETTPIFGASWHSDWSFQAQPPSATLLHAKTIPPTGGDTLFANCTLAYDALSDDLRRRLEGLFAVHSAAPSYGPNGLFAKDDPSRSMRIIVSAEAERTETHPIVRTHPWSGRKSLFINHVYTIAVAGMDAQAGRALLNQLFRHMTREEFVYRHRWQRDMLVLWDNRCVVHYAAGGYAGHERIMHRITLAGERPV